MSHPVEPKVFIIVLNWNGWQDTLECLASLKELVYSNYEVVVVDNGSTDESKSRIREAYPDITLLETGSNLGFAGGNNVGIRYALDQGSEYLWLLNNDTIADPASLRTMISLMQENARIGFISPEIYYYDEPDMPTGTGGKITPLNPKLTVLHTTSAGTRLYECQHLFGAAVLVRTAAMWEVGELDESYFLYREETDLLLRAATMGWKIAVAGRARIWHKVSRTVGYGSGTQEYFMTLNTLRLVRRYYKAYYPWILLSYLPYRVFAAIYKHRQSRLSTIRACLRAILDHLRDDDIREAKSPGLNYPCHKHHPDLKTHAKPFKMDVLRKRRALRFSLIVGTIEKTYTLERLLASLHAQTHGNFELIVVDQNPDERIAPVLAPYKSKLSILHLRQKSRGLSRARNLGLRNVNGDIVAFPDDDCEYPPDLLDTVAQFFVTNPERDGVIGRSIDKNGKTSMGRFDTKAGLVTKLNVWARSIEYTTFLRRESIGGVWFDKSLGVGAGTAWGSAEGTDYLLRLLNQGAALYYNPDLVVVHASFVPPYATMAARRAYSYGCGMGRVLRKHRYPLWSRMKYLVRPLGGMVLSLIRWRLPEAKYRWSTFRGRLEGLLS